jgi:hypothetical protein
MMVLWNKVSPTSPYLDDVQPSVGKGPMRVRYVFKSWILVCIPEEAVGWLLMRLSQPLLLVYFTTRSRIFNTLF